MSRPTTQSAAGSALIGVLRRFELLAGGIDWKRSALDGSVLQGALPVRAATARYRATLADAREREQRFLEASASYASALRDEESFGRHARAVQVDGLTWWVPLTEPDDEQVVQRYLCHQDFPYRAITQTRELGVGGIMIDIGGNNGRMSIPRVVLGDVQAAYCAEPEPLNYSCLVRNVRDNGLGGLVMPDRVAIGSENGSVRLVRAKSPGGHKVVDAGTRSKRETIEVASFTLDTWCARLGVDLQQVSFIKMDAQGSEVHVLRGATRVLACRHIAWQIEVDLALLRERSVALTDLSGILGKHFTHWIDLNRRAYGARVRPLDELTDGLSYLLPRHARTDIVVFTLQSPVAQSGSS